tara:strand:- start:490 stop:654 length:165 start_codon:yes stop_codon:yes gene_type:complete
LGELVDPIYDFSAFSIFATFFGLFIFSFFVGLSSEGDNDDDDSNTGGGLMQPIT